MKLFNKFAIFMLSVFAIFNCVSCASVSRVEADEDVELDGYWSDTDVRIVCEDIIDQVLKSKRIVDFSEKKGRTPIVTIGNIKNDSDEYIDTEIVANNLKTAIINSGELEFLANKDFRDELRQEVSDQADYADPNQAKEFANEDAADYMLSGSIKTMVQNDGKKSFRSYFVTIELNDVESHRTVGIFQPSPENQPRKMFKKRR